MLTINPSKVSVEGSAELARHAQKCVNQAGIVAKRSLASAVNYYRARTHIYMRQ